MSESQNVIPFLSVKDAHLLVEFMKAVFGGEVVSLYKGEDEKIMYCSVRVRGTLIELSEAHEPFGCTPAALHIYVDDCDATYQHALAHGALSLYEPTDHEYGERSGGVKDIFGNSWYIATLFENGS